MLLSDVCRLSVCRLSVAYIRPRSTTERPRKNKIGTEVAHVTSDFDTTFKVKRSKGQRSRSPGRFTHRRIGASGGCSGVARDVRTCWPWETAATLPSARRRKALRRPGGGEGRGHTVAAARLQLVMSVV